MAYFVQLSAMFKASSVLPQLFALVNLQLLGGHTISQSAPTTSDSSVADDVTVDGVCIVPLDDVERIRLNFVSPLVALGLLVTVALMQAALQAALSKISRRGSENNDSSLNASTSRTTAWRVYGWLFVAAEPCGQLTVGAHQHQSSAGWAGGAAAGGARSLLEERNEPLINDAQPAHDREQQAASPVSKLSVWRAYQRSIVRLLLLSYSGLSVVALSCLHWQAVGEYGWRLSDYPTVVPGSSEWSALLPGVVLVLGVVCCAPMAVMLFLWQQHRSGHVADVKQKLQQRTVNATQLTAREQLLLQLTAMYGTQHWWMPAYVLVRRLLAAVLLVTVRQLSVWAWLTIAGIVQLVI